MCTVVCAAKSVATPAGSSVHGAAALAASPRSESSFNGGWLLHVGDPEGAQSSGFDDSQWKPVTLPRAWNEDEAFRLSIDKLSTGIAWYRKHFTLPASAAGSKVFLEFEGVRQAGEVWVNGQALILHENGVTAFGVDITDVARFGGEGNVVAVRTDNDWKYKERQSGRGFQWSDRNFNANYGGISKNVRLHLTGRVYQTLPLFSSLGTTGTYVYATDFDFEKASATVHVETQVRNEGLQSLPLRPRVELIDAEGVRVSLFEGPAVDVAPGATVTLGAASPVAGLKFWSWGYGYLYSVRTSLVSGGVELDAVSLRTGFRKTEFGSGMVKLNGRVLQLKGYAQRTSNEWPAIGLSVPAWLSDYSNGLMVESNANLVRWMHIAPWRQDVESCDRVGLLQMLPAGDSEKDAQGRSWEQRVEVMRDAIIQFRNNPSVLVYEAGNKGVSEEHMAEMKALRDRYDPHGGRAAGSREMLDSKVAEYGGEMLYINKSARHPLWATEYSRDEGLRKYWDEFSPPYHKNGDGPLHRNAPAPAYNHNQDSHAMENVVRWHDYWRERPGTGRRVSSGGVNIVFSDTNTHYRGAENYRRSGEVDALRIPKDGFFAHQVMWDGWVDTERFRSHLLGHWNYAPGTVKDVTVVSSASAVELFLNGRSLGQGRRSSHFLFTFDKVAWEPGTLTAVGRDAAGRELCRDERTTAEAPASLRLTALHSPLGWNADGHDLVLVQVEVVDARGRRCPTALDLVEFFLDGPAEWRGGIAQGPDNYILSRSLPVECGVNRVLLRSTLQAGTVRLRAVAAGLAPATLELSAVRPSPALVPGADLPGAGLPSVLRRGPTPSGPSFVPSRVALEIVATQAGSNADTASRSHDDNEVTAWTSTEAAGAWIEYTLADEQPLHEVCLKLTGWRERSYPLRITVDGKEAWKGVTPRSLGYVTLPLGGIRGRVVRLEQLGGSEARDAFGVITEVADQANASTGAAKVRSGSLSIVEAELYRLP